jgi:aminopeptidase N
VRPDSYIEINNFYTSTVYEKGAEVVRMIQTLIGRQAFRRGMDLYFARHDGQAVTCDDFVAAMADASGIDLSQFKRWYDHAGTPRLRASGVYDPATRRYVLSLSQSGPTAAEPGSPSPDSPSPFHIPVAIGLIDPHGIDMPLHLAGESDRADQQRTTCVLSLTEPEQEFVFEDLAAAPVPSLLRDFSAPVILDYDWRDEDLSHLLAHDSDPFNRWEAGQRLASRLILAAAVDIAAGRPAHWPLSFAEAALQVLLRAGEDPAFAAEALTLPGEATLAEEIAIVDPDALHAARNGLRCFVAEQLQHELRQCYESLAPDAPYQPTPAAAGRRALRNLCLGYLSELDTAETRTLAMQQFVSADNMTDQFAALATLAQYDCRERAQALAAFYERWHDEALVVDKWLSVQASSRLPGTLVVVQELLAHPAFDLHNPNKVYALLNTFGNNHVRFMPPTAVDTASSRRRSASLIPAIRRLRHAWRGASIAGASSIRLARHTREQRSKTCGPSTACRQTCLRSSGEPWPSATRHIPAGAGSAQTTRQTAAAPASRRLVQIVLERGEPARYNLALQHGKAPVAQLDRVLGYEPRGRAFESLRACQ